MTETTEKYNDEKAASALAPPPPPPPPYYPMYHAPYATYADNPNYPMGQQAIVYPQVMDPNIQRIHEYLPWSLMNICFRGFILGAIAVVLSLVTRSYKNKGDAVSARRWSITTLVFNIFVTLLGMAIIIFLIIRFAVLVKRVHSM